MLFLLVLLLFWRPEGAATLGGFNCSGYSVDPYISDFEVAFKWYGPFTAVNGTWIAAKAYCESLCPQCRLAISRSKVSLVLLYDLTVSGRKSNGTYQVDRASWLGLRKVNSSWIWVDGKVCEPSNPMDQRCFNRTHFDDSGPFGSCITTWKSDLQIFENNYWIDDSDQSIYGDGAMLCEVPVSSLCRPVVILIFLQF
jgi:hypothetical protein